jgi:hypothetical protein
MPPNTRLDMTRIAPHAEVWVGHRRYDEDAIAGVDTFVGISHVDPDAGKIVETREMQPCGAKGAAQVDDLLVVSPECTHQLTVINLKTGSTEIVPSFQHDTDLHPLGDNVWLRWTELGFIAKFDPKTKTMKTLDLNADGPLLRAAYVADRTRGDTVWAFGFPADPDLPDVIYRIDPDTVAVTARGFVPDRLSIVDGVGYTITTDGRVARLDLDGVQGGAPPDVVRPSPIEAKPFQPRTADERDVLETFSRVFSPAVTNADAAPYLEDAAGLDAVRTNLGDLARRIGDSLQLVVTQVTIRGDTASISYSYMLDGKIAFVPFAGSLQRVGDKWIVSRASMCRLAQQAAVKGC